MRASGMKLVHLWVADPASPDYAQEARRQALVIANSPDDEDDLAFIDSLAEEVFAEIEASEE